MTAQKIAAMSVPVYPLLAQRWSPRGLDVGHELGQRSVLALLEAARWAPSANNSQPWRFLVAHRGGEAFRGLLDVLAPGNRSWAHAASALVLVAAQTIDNTGRSCPWALFDTGQAVAALSVQAQADGLSVHQMGGFDADAARSEFDVETALTPLVVLAVGRRDPDAQLPEPLASRERAPRSREPLEALMLTAPEAPRGESREHSPALRRRVTRRDTEVGSCTSALQGVGARRLHLGGALPVPPS